MRCSSNPHSTWTLERASVAEATEILFALRERCRALARRHPEAIVVFRNHRAGAGTSQRHPHSQLVALDHAPPGLAQRWDRARIYYGQTGRCLHEHIAERERTVGSRVIHDADGILVFQPHTAVAPYETCIMPDEPAADLASAGDSTLTAVAELVPRVVAALGLITADPAYNLIVHGGPATVPDASVWFRWHVSVQPRITVPGGFELATGLTVAPCLPDRATSAARVRRDGSARPVCRDRRGAPRYGQGKLGDHDGHSGATNGPGAAASLSAVDRGRGRRSHRCRCRCDLRGRAIRR